MAMTGSWDVAVVGGGIFGLASAYACARRGLRVALLERGRVASGASGGIVGAMAPHVPEQWNPKKQFQFEALCAADGFWAEVDAASGLSSGFGRVGRLVPVVDERGLELALSRVQGAAELWGGRFGWTHLPQGHALIAPQAAPFGVVHDTLSGRIYPALACASLRVALEAAGGTVLEGHAVDDISTGRVSGPWGAATAQTVILASGVDGFALIERWTGRRAGSAVKGQAALLACDLNAAPQIYADGIYIVPHANGTVAVGSTSESSFTDATGTDAQLDDIVARARAICPALRDAQVLQRWAGLRPKARRRDPMLGPVPGAEGVYAAMGAFKIGFGIAHKVGDVLADYATGTPVELPESFTVAHHLA
jgi:glycine oxidase